MTDDASLPMAWDATSGIIEQVAVRITDEQAQRLASRRATDETYVARISLDDREDPTTELEHTVLETLRTYGLSLVQQFPLDLDDQTSASRFVAFCERFGTVRPQDGATERWRFVEHKVAADGTSGTTGSTGRMHIALHTENARPPHPPRLIALLCIRPAPHGGASQLASGQAVRQRLARQHPKALAVLSEPVPFARRREEWAAHAPFDQQPVFGGGDRLNMRYSRYWIDLAIEQSNVELSADTITALNRVDAVLSAPDLSLRRTLRSGEAIIVDNKTVLHGRDAYDDTETTRRRLVRVWLD